MPLDPRAISVETMPVHGSSLTDLDMRLLEDYFLDVLGEEAVADWRRTLLNRELLVADEWRPEVRTCSHAGNAWRVCTGAGTGIIPGT